MSKQEPIHSGHFMTSDPHKDAPDDEDEDVEVDVVDVDEGISAVPLDKNAAKEKDVEKPVTFYKFGPQKTQSIAIDVSLNKLNKCIRVAYMKMTTPKWKDFKGLKLQWKSRIRLNNVIWRAYYMEFRKPGRKRKNPYCYFSVPDDDTTHTKLEGSILEGMYWKRRMEAVCAQYKRWRAFNSRKKRCCRKRENSCGCEMAPSAMMKMPSMVQKANQSQQSNQQMRSLTPENTVSEQWNNDWLIGSLEFDDDDNEFTNQLFEQLNAPFIFPNPKEGGCWINNADIMQPGLLSLQPSIEEIMSTDYPFGPDETSQLVDEFANSLPETSGDNTPNQRQQQRPYSATQSNGKVMIQQQPQQQYTTKEYDAANMLIDYSNRAMHQPPQQQQPQRPSAPSTTAALRRPSATPMTMASNARQPSASAKPAMPVPVVTPNISNPLYSQAAVYQPQRLAGPPQIGEQHQFGTTTSTQLDPILYSRGAPPPPPMSTKIANQTSLTHQTITSMASSPHPSQFLPSAIDYSLLVAASSSAVALSQAIVGQSTLAGPSRPQQQQPWPWFTQQQPQPQQIYSPIPQHHQHGQIARKSSNGIEQQQPPSAQAPPQPQISPLALSTNNFSNQSLVASSRSPGLPYASALTNLVSPQQNGGLRPQSALTAHLQQKQPLQQQQQQDGSSSLLQTLAASANPQTTVRQFVMSDLSRYLTQQSPIGVLQPASTSTNHHHPHSLVPSLAQLNTTNIGGGNIGGSNLSPIGAPHYSPATTPLSAPIIGTFNSGQQNRPSSQQPPKQQQIQLLQSQHSSELTFASPPPPKKASTSALPSSTNFQQLLSPKKGRASFSSAQRPAHLGKRQMQQKQIGGEASAENAQMQFTGGRPENPPQFGSPVKASRRWSSGRRQQSVESHSHQPQLTPLTPPPVQHDPQQMVPRRKGQSVCEAVRRNEQQQQPQTTMENDESPPETANKTTLMQLGGLQQKLVMKEENTDEKPIAMLIAPMSHKRRHQSTASASSASQTGGVSSSHSAPADSTLHPEERKRILHLNAEKNRRSALKDGFECLVNAIPMVEQAGVKCTNAVVLNRAAQHVRDLRADEEQQQKQIKAFREKITGMNERIAMIQSNLPSSSISGSKASDNAAPTMRIQVDQFFDRYKRDRSRADFRFWLMAEVLKPIVNSFAEQVHPDSGDRERVMLSTRKWLDTHWNSAVLRPIASDMLVRVATANGAFTSEQELSGFIAQQVNKEIPGVSKPQS